MGRLIVTDLMGTLLEADHIIHPGKCGEYNSRIMKAGRDLNDLLDTGVEIIILTNMSHTTVQAEKKVLNDLYAQIKEESRTRISFMLTDVIREDERELIMSPFEGNAVVKDGKLELFRDKSRAFDEVFLRYAGYDIVAIDDRWACFARVLKKGGKVVNITTELPAHTANLTNYLDEENSCNFGWEEAFLDLRNGNPPCAEAFEYIERIDSRVDDKSIHATFDIKKTLEKPDIDRSEEISLDSLLTLEQDELVKWLDTTQQECDEALSYVEKALYSVDLTYAFRDIITIIEMLQERPTGSLWEKCKEIRAQRDVQLTKPMFLLAQMAGLDELNEEYDKVKCNSVNRGVKAKFERCFVSVVERLWQEFGIKFLGYSNPNWVNEQMDCYRDVIDSEEQWVHYTGMLATYSEASLYRTCCLGDMDPTIILGALYGMGEISIDDLYLAYELNERHYGLPIEKMVEAYKRGDISLCYTFSEAGGRALKMFKRDAA